VRTSFRRRKLLDVFSQQAINGVVVALAEEIGFADGFVGERRLEANAGEKPGARR